MRSVALCVLVVACGKPAPAPAAPLAWLEGRWVAEDGAEETWTRAGGALFGVGFAQGFEVLVVADGKLTAMPGGAARVEFPLAEQGATWARFENPAHDDPKVVRYQREGESLRAEAGASTFAWRAAARAPAAELEAADLAFAADVAARRLEAWVEWFDPAGAMWTRAGRQEGHDAVRAAMAPLFAEPSFEILWKPVASGLAPGGELGFTVGESEYHVKGEISRGAYVTIWRKQPDGSWKVLFDTGV